MSHALLLRLFLSPSFFSVHVALQYLRLYADHIGISHYLTGRLNSFSPSELQDVWGFICHLLVTRPSQSNALETFVLERAELSTHIAMLTLFNMQASLQDLATTRRNTPSFMICQRVLNRCQDIVFGDPPPTTLSTPYSSPALIGRPSSRFWKKKVKPHLGPALAGMASVLATTGMPTLTSMTGKWAIDQGRAELSYEVQRPGLVNVEVEVTSPISKSIALPQKEVEDKDPPENTESGDDEPSPQAPELVAPVPKSPFTKGMSLDLPSHIPASTKVAPGAAQTSPMLPLPGSIRKSSRTTDPFGQLDHSHAQTLPSSSSPSISLRTPLRSMSTPEPILNKYDMQYQSSLLRSHYCKSEMNFLQGLESISNRLLVVPKPARVSALRAELTALNHRLPAEVCMPMWCNSSDVDRTAAHHRIVRIPPGESVVLNSAERAPYLLYIEILEEDLDFDASKRNNRDLLTRIVSREERKLHVRSSTDGSGLGRSSLGRAPSLRKAIQKDSLGAPSGSVEEFGYQAPVNTMVEPDSAMELPSEETSISPPPTEDQLSAHPNEPDEEMDLVEQLYGTNLKGETADLSDSIVLPHQPKNKMLELKTWSSATTPSSAMFPNEAGETSTTAPGTLTGMNITMEDYSERMRAAASMLAQLNASLVRDTGPSVNPSGPQEDTTAARGTGPLRWLPGKGWILGSSASATHAPRSSTDTPAQQPAPSSSRSKLQPSEVAAITERIMQEMLALEEERMARMREQVENEAGGDVMIRETAGGKTAEDEGIVRRELNKADPSAAVFRESWAAKKARIRSGSPYGHLANWDCVSVIVKTGGDLRQEQLAVQLIQLFEKIWKEEQVGCWVRYFRILVTGNNSGLVETITDSVSIHSIKKTEYAKRLAQGDFTPVTLFDHFVSTYGDPSSAKFVRAQRNFAKSLAAYSIITYLLQIKDRHNGNILLDRDGHLVHIDFGFMLSNSPGNMGFEAAPFKLPLEYVEVLGGLESEHWKEFKKLFLQGFEAARKHCDSIITLVELMQKDSTLPCFAAFGELTAQQLRDRFQPNLKNSSVADFVDKLIVTSLGSAWTRLYDSYQYYSQSIL
ncbi:Phosphatidylinositol 4-kinase pik1alpha (PI4-kinase)(PtdIns-4-kinase) [Tulasnella sp. 419]|nr:Phosphatidylinositol 4-kinase pik1alpha (PI4-kinase)(PtdIns-4-kinase) [Tulasnella sp. 419]